MATAPHRNANRYRRAGQTTTGTGTKINTLSTHELQLFLLLAKTCALCADDLTMRTEDEISHQTTTEVTEVSEEAKIQPGNKLGEELATQKQDK